MKIQEVIDYVDSVKPNAYSTKAKVEWLSDIDSMIKNEVMKEYKSFYIVGGKGEYDLPPGVKFDDIVRVYVDNKEIDKIDLRSFNKEGYFKQNENKISIYPIPENNTNIKVIYQVRLKRYKQKELILPYYWQTTFFHGTITNAVLPGSFEILDTIEISGCSVFENNKKAMIMDIYGDTIELNTTFKDVSVVENITLSKPLDDELLAESPHDKLYREYIIAQIDWLNREYEAYNNDIELFNTSYKSFLNYYKQKNPLETVTAKNIW